MFEEFFNIGDLGEEVDSFYNSNPFIYGDASLFFTKISEGLEIAFA